MVTGRDLAATIGLWLAVCAAAAGGADWTPVPYTDGDMRSPDTKHWQPYRGSHLDKVPGGPGTGRVLRVTVRDKHYGGLRILASPRGGMGNRVRVTLTYRVVSGGPVAVHAGPNTWDQLAGVLASPKWETAIMELGLLFDFHLVLHVAQSAPTGVFELAALAVAARKGDRRRVDVAIRSDSPSQPGVALARRGQPAPTIERVAHGGAVDPAYHLTCAGNGYVHQGLGQLPAGTRLTLECQCRVAPGVHAVAGFLHRHKPMSQQRVAHTQWAPCTVTHVLQQDGRPAWFIGRPKGNPVTLWVADYHVWAELPDPVGPGVVKLQARRRPITFTVGDAKSIRITPPWVAIPPLLCHLEYNSRWGFKFPASHELKLSDNKDEMTLVWHFKDDPVRYTVHMRADRPDAALVEARITNTGEKPTPAFVPGFCLQTCGAHAPKTFDYTIIPREGKPFPLSRGHRWDTRPSLWPCYGWVRSHYTGSDEYARRLGKGETYKPPAPAWIQEAGDFPLLARRLPGRDAWIAWVWPDATRYFGNTQSPCMHMDPIVAPCPPGQTRRVFGRLIFFEGTWDQLYARARQQRAELSAERRSGPGGKPQCPPKAKP